MAPVTALIGGCRLRGAHHGPPSMPVRYVLLPPLFLPIRRPPGQGMSFERKGGCRYNDSLRKT